MNLLTLYARIIKKGKGLSRKLKGFSNEKQEKRFYISRTNRSISYKKRKKSIENNLLDNSILLLRLIR